MMQAMNVEAAVKSLIDEMHGLLAKSALQPSVLREIHSITTEIMAISKSEPATGFDWSEYELSRKELQICKVLHRALNREFSQEQIYSELYWDDDDGPDVKIIDIFVFKIRQKLDFFKCPFAIETVWGQGYRMVPREHLRRYESHVEAAKPYVPRRLKSPIKQMGQRVYIWEGVRMGPALAAMAMKLKGAQGESVPISELGPKRGPVHVQICRLNKRMAGLYEFRLIVQRDGYAMFPAKKSEAA